MRRSPVAIGILVAVLPSAALAWNHTGHRLSAIIAFDRLKAGNPDRAAKLIELLKQHPFFDRDFNRKMPPAVRDGSKADQDRWVFAQAATWPDIVRSRSHPGHEQHHHATWHFRRRRPTGPNNTGRLRHFYPTPIHPGRFPAHSTSLELRRVATTVHPGHLPEPQRSAGDRRRNRGPADFLASPAGGGRSFDTAERDWSGYAMTAIVVLFALLIVAAMLA